MNIYCKLPFGKLHARNPTIISLAEHLDRTPGSVAMKLCNFASLDPVHAARGVSGLTGASQGDREVWQEFNKDWEARAFESERMIAELRGESVEKSAEINEADLPREGLERERVVKQRVNQYFFRSAVLAAYDRRCCITGLAVPELLIASHVVPWSVNKAARVNPRNGLCLNALHDRAFDRGLITLTPDFRIAVSPKIRSKTDGLLTKRWILDFEGKEIRLPERFLPDAEFVAWHRDNVFQST
ncbi:MAG: HNH endonuclease [Chthoniobacter sp.]|nr:HNH endonuclease [Chthoniobacter sp.]